MSDSSATGMITAESNSDNMYTSKAFSSHGRPPSTKYAFGKTNLPGNLAEFVMPARLSASTATSQVEAVEAERRKASIISTQASLIAQVVKDTEQQLRAELTKEVKEDVAKKYATIASQHKEEVKAELINSLTPEIKATLRAEYESQVKQELYLKLQKEVKDTLYQDLEPSVRASLKEDLRDSVREELRNELYEQACDEVAADAEIFERDLRQKKVEDMEAKLRADIDDAARRLNEEQAQESNPHRQLTYTPSEGDEEHIGLPDQPAEQDGQPGPIGVSSMKRRRSFDDDDADHYYDDRHHDKKRRRSEADQPQYRGLRQYKEESVYEEDQGRQNITATYPSQDMHNSTSSGCSADNPINLDSSDDEDSPRDDEEWDAERTLVEDWGEIRGKEYLVKEDESEEEYEEEL